MTPAFGWSTSSRHWEGQQLPVIGRGNDSPSLEGVTTPRLCEERSDEAISSTETRRPGSGVAKRQGRQGLKISFSVIARSNNSPSLRGAKRRSNLVDRYKMAR